MTEDKRKEARNNLYLFALGPLGLSHEDLWQVTNGQLGDLLDAWHYKQYLERRERAYMTSILANLWSKRRITVQDIVGIWHHGQTISKEDFIEKWKENRRRKKGIQDGQNTTEVRYRRGFGTGRKSL
jgi:uncharacterized protein (DUF433 family)